MVEEKDVAVEEEPIVNDGKVSMDKEDSETSKESSTEKTEETGTSGKDEKTTSEDVLSEEGQDDEVKDDGKPIPYERFKKVIGERNAGRTENESLKADWEEVVELLGNAGVFKAVLQAKGITDPQIIAEKLKEAGFKESEEKPKSELYKQFAQGLNLSKQESWFEVMERMFKHFSREALNPIERKLSEKDTKAYIESQETEAKKIAKDKYGLEYGQAGKDEGNINTAVGKMWKYLEKHPEDAHLGHVKILSLALADEGIKLGEEKGVKKEKERHKSLRESAMEDDAQLGKDETPNADWSTSKILAWRRKYGK